MIKYKPEGAESNSPASQGYALFNFNPDYSESTKNDCWYRTDPKLIVDEQDHTNIQPWFPLPSNLVNKGKEWIPEIQLNATRYDSSEICDLERSDLGKVPCLSYFETEDRPAKTIRARAAQGFNVEPQHGYVVTPNGQDHFTLKLQTPLVRSLGDQVKVEFKVQPNLYYNGTQCAKFNPIIFNQENWDKPLQVDMSFIDYGCCTYAITANGGGYEWLYTTQTFVVYACDGQAGYGCIGKQPCGA
ncbi:unnamed protein product [Adineta steineri]|uniref:Uncharacterized protein n=1 Tax=Adineta steineri TaxID=433720 RepID=A0A813PVS5_9BILA|nr:unnamed protein product [Adineta steineri]CAF0795056.1 unnamed protein product [Adineta steineri]